MNGKLCENHPIRALGITLMPCDIGSNSHSHSISNLNLGKLNHGWKCSQTELETGSCTRSQHYANLSVFTQRRSLKWITEMQISAAENWCLFVKNPVCKNLNSLLPSSTGMRNSATEQQTARQGGVLLAELSAAMTFAATGARTCTFTWMMLSVIATPLCWPQFFRL